MNSKRNRIEAANPAAECNVSKTTRTAILVFLGLIAYLGALEFPRIN